MNIFGLGTPEILLIVFLLLVFFGKDKLPGLARSIGDTFRELKNSLNGTEEKKPSDTVQPDATNEPKKK
jgi:sec-independent protein translocase protein TatA